MILDLHADESLFEAGVAREVNSNHCYAYYTCCVYPF